MAEQFKPIPIGHSDFQTIIEKDLYYVDKSLLIKDVLDSGAEVTLITRPRRFGKTLNLSMLRYFFEAPIPIEARYPSLLRANSPAEKEKNLFKHLSIWNAGEKYTSHYQKYPVIVLSFKDAKQANWTECLRQIGRVVSEEYSRHSYLLEKHKKMNETERRTFNSIILREAEEWELKESLRKLTKFLYDYHNHKVILLIDEYDTPVHEAYDLGFYDEVIGFMRSLFGQTLKDNLYLEKAIITGILRVTKESLFSDLNNPKIVTILDELYGDKFGFTEEEVFQFLKDYGIEKEMGEVRAWYDGYTIGKYEIYNPWSILNFVDAPSHEFRPYWINTSGNRLVNHLLVRSDKTAKKELEELLEGKSITKRIHSHIVFSEIEKTSESLWSFLLFTGYLKIVDFIQPETDTEDILYKLVIPNLEVKSIYRKFVGNWVTDYLNDSELNLFYRAIVNGDTKTIRQALQKYTKESMSFFDPTGTEPERVYHCFVLGLLLHIKTHTVRSNRESGFGRYDIMLIPKDLTQAGVVIEFKKVEEEDGETLESACEEALLQIQKLEYSTELKGMGVEKIFEYGVAFDGKKILVRSLV
jgi:hypothetical protein